MDLADDDDLFGENSIDGLPPPSTPPPSTPPPEVDATPVVPATEKKKKSKKAKAKKLKKKKKRPSKAELARAKRARRVAFSSDEDEDADEPLPAPSKKRRVLVESDDGFSDDEGDGGATATALPIAASAPTDSDSTSSGSESSSSSSSSSSDSDDEEEAPPATDDEKDPEPITDLDAFLRVGSEFMRPGSSEAAPAPARQELLGDDSNSSSQAEEVPDTNANAATNGERIVDIRAHEFISAHPPTMVFMVGKTPASQAPMTFVGDLVRDMSCPLHTFRVRMRDVPGEVCENGAPVFFVLDIVKVVKGPIAEAAKAAVDRARDAGSAVIGEVAPRVTVTRIRTAIKNSDYFRHAQNRPAAIAAETKRMSEAFGSQPIQNAADLERFAPPDGDTTMSWACRNAMATARFFEAANKVGGAAARTIGLDNAPVWAAIDGDASGSGSASASAPLARGAVRRILETIHFANPLSEFRAERIHTALGVLEDPELMSITECIVRAAAVLHSLPSATSSMAPGSSIVHSDINDVWPEPMREMLTARGLHVARDSTRRWFACREATRSFFNGVTDSIAASDVRFVRAECDDDPNIEDEKHGYIARLRKEVGEVQDNLIVLSANSVRVKYLSHHTGDYGAKFLLFNTFCSSFVPKPTNILWVDRAHLLKASELTQMLRKWGGHVKTIYLTGSIWANTTRFEVTLFAQLFAASRTESRDVLTATLSAYKAAPVGANDPMDDNAKIPGTPIIVGRAAAACPDDLRKKFLNSRVYSVAQLAAQIDITARAAILVFDSQWTREDLATVWPLILPQPNAIWVTGGQDWRIALRNTSRSVAGARALMSNL